MNDKELKSILDKIEAETLERFTYVSDMSLYGKDDYWASPCELPDKGPFEGDCDDFALMCRKLCREAGITTSRVVFCTVPEANNQGHLVCEVNGFILDCRSTRVMRIDELPYKWIKMSGYNSHEPWTTIDVEHPGKES